MSHYMISWLFVGNVPKGRISKRVFQEDKTRQIFRKMNISYPLIRIRTCVSGVRNVFRKIYSALFSWNTRFDIRLFTLLPACYEAPNDGCSTTVCLFHCSNLSQDLKNLFFLILPFFPIILLFAPMILLENQFYEDFSWFLIQSMMLFFLKMCEMCFRNVISSFK